MKHTRHKPHRQLRHKHELLRIYQPVMDWWVAGLVLLLIALFSAAIPVFIASPLAAWQIVLAVILMMGLILYITDLSFFSYYVLGPRGLSIVSQLRHAFFAYRDMVEIKPGNVTGLISFAGKKRFSLSANCFLIRLRHNRWRAITISPAEKNSFIDFLLEQIDHERSSRASVERAHS